MTFYLIPTLKMQKFALISPLNTNPKGEKKAKSPQQGETQMKPEKEIKDNISGHTKGGTSKKHRSSGS